MGEVYEPEPVAAESTADAANGVVSPDGRWLAYQSRTGRPEIYIQPYPQGGAVIPVSSGGGASPRWSVAGDELYYSWDCQFFAVRVTSGPALGLDAARPLFKHCDPMSRWRVNYDIGPDGRFYMLEAVPDSGIVTSLELVLHWTDSLAAAFGPGPG